jgi:flagellar protein FlaF
MLEKNPYMKASDAYVTTATETDQRALEGKVLLKSAAKLEDLANRLKSGENVHFTEVGAILDHNQKLWILFVDEALSAQSPLPQEIKNNIVSLGLFVFKRTKDLLIEPSHEKLQILISINRNIASGLMKRVAGAEAPPSSAEKATAGADSFA